MKHDPYADPNCDQEALERPRELSEAWKQTQPDPQCVEDVIRLGELWRASAEHEECRRLLAK